MKKALAVLAIIVFALPSRGAEEARIRILATEPQQTFEGLGVGAIFYEGHITSLSARKKHDKQEQLYDLMFTRIPTQYLQLMIRETHEPENDNNDPYLPKFRSSNFAYCRHTLQIAKAALKRQPDIKFFATLYTPPPWMKTNNSASGGGKERATIKDNLELEVAEYMWAFLQHMKKNGVTVHYLSIANEPDWAHDQPGYYLSAPNFASLFKVVGEYLDKMAKKYPDVPRPKLVGPNTLSAPGAAKKYVPLTLKAAGKHLDVIASHDYDQRGDRWGDLRKIGGKRSVWMSEWCARNKDNSPGMINSALEYGVSMHKCFTEGVNAYLAYDWVYPPRDSGEALIHVKWGNDYILTKPYHLFRQWAAPLKPGMHVLKTSIAGQGADIVKPTAFLSADGRTVVIHAVNASDKDMPVKFEITGSFRISAAATRTRTSAIEDALLLSPCRVVAGRFSDTLKARSMVTYQVHASNRGGR